MSTVITSPLKKRVAIYDVYFVVQKLHGVLQLILHTWIFSVHTLKSYVTAHVTMCMQHKWLLFCCLSKLTHISVSPAGQPNCHLNSKERHLAHLNK